MEKTNKKVAGGIEATVVYEGRVNIRSAPKMDPGNIVGKATTGQKFIALDTIEENGQKWYCMKNEQYIIADEKLVTSK